MTDDDSEYQELVEWLTVKVAEYVNVPPDTIGIDTPLADCGIDSLSAVALCTDLQYEKGFDVDTTIVWDHPTIDAMAEYLVTEGAPP
jgi:aryl carrier-like protein